MLKVNTHDLKTEIFQSCGMCGCAPAEPCETLNVQSRYINERMDVLNSQNDFSILTFKESKCGLQYVLLIPRDLSELCNALDERVSYFKWSSR